MDYRDYPSHRLMLRDAPRTEAFRRAIAAVVKPGDVVLDVGAGVGILSLLAAKAGAARVYAVERTGVVAMGMHLAQLNGLADRVQFFQCDVRAAPLPEKVDVIVSEWMGTIGVDENMLGSVLWARDQHLKSNGHLIPKSVTAWMAPVRTDQRPDARFFNNRPYDLELAPLAEPSIHELLMVRRRMRPSDMAVPAQILWTTDVGGDPPQSVSRPYQGELRFIIKKPARVSALAAWHVSELAAGVTLSNAPDAPDTHWGQLMLPLDSELALNRGDVLEARVEATSLGPGPLQFAWWVRINEGDWQQHNTLDWGQPDAVRAATTLTEELPAKRSELSRFLAVLAMDPDLLGAFLVDPDSVMAGCKVSATAQAALKSRDPYAIQNALYEADARQ